jgi:hypothetical protein
MWTTKEWQACLTRTAEYEKRECKRSQGTKYSGASTRKTEGDAENSGLEQWLKVKFVKDQTSHLVWFWNNWKE